jgi:D-alanyl-D-alanine carboxypeptidase
LSGGHHHAQTHGFMDLAKNLVVALTAAGLLWGGRYQTGKDIMHFDLRTGTVRHRT